MNIIFKIGSILMLTIVFACGSSKTSIETIENECQQISKSKPSIDQAGSFKVTSMSIENDCLLLNGYVSGCSEGESELIWNGVSTRSLPPQITVELVVFNSGECDMIIEKEWSFDLSKEKFDDVIIKLKDHSLETRYTP